MLKYGFDNGDVHRIYARPYGGNIASQKLPEKPGFVKEGLFKEAIFKNGAYLDLLVYSVLRT
jgi:[ribosomal protein S5]-alanine N-acetyltransferase